MITIRISVLLCLILLASCGGTKMMYAKYGKLKLDENEINAYPVPEAAITAYENCCYTESQNLFLNRSINDVQSKYQIFISLSETMLQPDFAEAQKADKTIQILNSKSELISKIKVDGYFLKKNDRFVARFTYIEIRSGILIVFDVTSKEESVAKSFYDNMKSYLNEKIRL
jgi:hypothetical protein